MPELRKDPIVNRWIVLASERSRRPSDFAEPPPRVDPDQPCPFCPGNERHTPPEILAVREPATAPNGPGWSTRVIPNKFPALQVEGGLDRRGEGLYDRMNGIGAHEVIIETPQHDRELSQLPVEQVEQALRAYRERVRDLNNDLRLRHILLFKNHGASAGATLEHSHTQLLATPILPEVVAEELEGSLRHYEAKERCVYCDVLEQEIEDGRRVVSRGERFVAFAPFASRFPFETWILPRQHRSAFERIEDAEIAPLATIFRDVLARLARALNRPSYNFLIHTAPCREPDLPHYHWHVEIIPKLTRMSGFEWGTGVYINPTTPEEAAEYLRSCEPVAPASRTAEV